MSYFMLHDLQQPDPVPTNEEIMRARGELDGPAHDERFLASLIKSFREELRRLTRENDQLHSKYNDLSSRFDVLLKEHVAIEKAANAGFGYYTQSYEYKVLTTKLDTLENHMKEWHETIRAWFAVYEKYVGPVPNVQLSPEPGITVTQGPFDRSLTECMQFIIDTTRKLMEEKHGLGNKEAHCS